MGWFGVVMGHSRSLETKVIVNITQFWFEYWLVVLALAFGHG